MYRILKINYIEFKNNVLFNKNIIFLFSSLILLILIPPYNNFYEKTRLSFLHITLYLMLVYFCGLISFEFEYKTSKVIFTSGLSRLQVMVWKTVSIFLISIFICLIYNILLMVTVHFSSENIQFIDVIKGFYVSLAYFMIFGFFVGSFTILVSSITFSSLFSFVISFVFFDGIIADLIGLAGERFRIGIVREIIQSTPFYFATYGFRQQLYTPIQMITIIVSSIIFISVSYIIIKKRDLR